VRLSDTTILHFNSPAELASAFSMAEPVAVMMRRGAAFSMAEPMAVMTRWVATFSMQNWFNFSHY
jgi:hypothetical protein